MRAIGLFWFGLAAWADPVGSIQAVRAAVEANNAAAGDVTVECTVTFGTGYLQLGREELYCEDGTGGISVVIPERSRIDTGDRLRIQGRYHYSAEDDEPQIHARKLDRLPPVGPPAPREVPLAEAVAGNYRGRLISVSGQVTVIAPLDAERESLFLRDSAGNELRAYSRRPAGAPPTFGHVAPKPGDWITVTGLSLPREERRYQVRVRSSADVRRVPPEILFWSRALWAAFAAFAFAAILGFWAFTLRRNVTVKTKEVLRLLERSEEASRLKSEFLANMSHEIRTPLHGVLGMQRLVLDGKVAGEDRRHLEMAQESAQALLALLNDILDFSKIEANKLEFSETPFEPRRLLESVVALFVPAAEQKTLRIDWQVGDCVPNCVAADELRIRQILMNLISNAVKFTTAGGIRVDVGMQSPELLLVTVTDTGSGIPPEAQQRIFEPFRQADGSSSRRFGGTGLGLAISSRLASAMGGRLWLEYSSQNGTCFRFTAKVRPPETPDKMVEPPLAAVRPLSILVVEDNRVNQQLILKMLERAGHLTALAANGREALEMVEHSSFDLALMDVQMPEMDGVETTFRIRHRENLSGIPRMPIIGLTAHAMKGDRERFLAAGMDDYLSKPVSQEALLEALVRAVSAPTE